MKLFRRSTPQELPASEKEALTQLAQARNEPPAATLARFSRRMLRHMPRMPGCISVLRTAEFADAGVTRAGVPFISLPNGRIFYGLLSRPNHRRIYHYLADVLPPLITEDTFLLAMDVAKRYLDVADRSEGPAMPGARLVEAGAFLGHKTMWYCDTIVGETGRVLAIEMMPENVAVLKQNVAANHLENQVTVVEAGVWNKPGSVTAVGKGRQRNSLVQIDELEGRKLPSIRTDTLDNMLDAWGEPLIDEVTITVNGAEIEALEGLVRWHDRVKAIRVYAGYTRQGSQTIDTCHRILTEWGFRLTPQRVEHIVLAVNPKLTDGDGRYFVKSLRAPRSVALAKALEATGLPSSPQTQPKAASSRIANLFAAPIVGPRQP